MDSTESKALTGWGRSFLVLLNLFSGVMIFFLAGIVAPDFFGPTFGEPYTWIATLLVTGWFCMTCSTPRIRWLYLIPFLLALLGLMTSVREVRQARPLPTKVVGRSFTDAPLVEVFQFLADQRRDAPYWYFMLHGSDLTNRTVTVSIPVDCSLEDAIQSVCRASGSEFKWRYFKGCGNAPSPIWAEFWVWQTGQAEPTRRGGCSAWVTRKHIRFYPQELARTD